MFRTSSLFRSLLVMLMLAVAAIVPVRAAETLSLAFTPANPGGGSQTYIVVWLSGGTASVNKRTLLYYGTITANYYNQISGFWSAISGTKNNATDPNGVDARMGATQNSVIAVTKSNIDVSALPDGSYTLNFAVARKNNMVSTTTYAFTKNGTASSLSAPVSQNGWTLTTITYSGRAAVPSITTQPSNATVNEGSTATFTIAASGATSYQWQFSTNGTSWSNVSGGTGATTASYTTVATVVGDSGKLFRCAATNTTGTTNSNSATLAVNAIAPVISAQPAAKSVNVGSTATFSVTASSSITMTYQWQSSPNGTTWSNVSTGTGSTSASYTTAATVIGDSGKSFRCAVTNATGTTNSNGAILTVNALAPSITAQPAAQSVIVGSTATFSVTASSSVAMTYQWQVSTNGTSWANVSGGTGATTTSYTTVATVAGDNGKSFRCVVTNSGSGNLSTTSNAATLTVGTTVIAPAITTQPANTTVSDGQTATFSVVATGSPLNYQWKRGSTVISGATAATYSFTSSISDNGASFTCVVSNNAGANAVTSTAAIVTVNAVAPQITTQPASQSVTVGSSVTFSVAASGTAPLAYQWNRNDSPISGATSASYTFTAAAADDGVSFTCTVSNSASSVTSTGGVLNIIVAAPQITTNPTSLTVADGALASFSVGATGSGLAYQWKRNNATITGATNATYSFTVSVSNDGDSYTCAVSNSGGTVTSTAATLTVYQLPTITTQPTNVTVASAVSASFTVVATGTGPFAYQWRKDGTAITGNGATSATYTIATAALTDGGVYSCLVSNAYGSVTSADATLTVYVLPTFTTQPANVTVDSGASASFTVVATGTGSLTYQWQKNGTDISGATSATYIISATVVTDSGTYSCVVSNAYGSAVSTDAVLTVNAPTVNTSAYPFYANIITIAPGGTYAPKNVVAVWIESSTGTFIKTIGDWSLDRRSSLAAWQAKVGGSDTDAIMGATRTGHSDVLTVTWDLKAKNGTTVVDGAYKLRVEVADSNPGGTNLSMSVPFTISAGAVPAQAVTNTDGSEVAINGTIASTSATAANDQAGCGVGSVNALIGFLGLTFLLWRRRQRS